MKKRKKYQYETASSSSTPSYSQPQHSLWLVLISWRLSDSELQNLSTQLADFSLVGQYHASPMLQIPHGLCAAHEANPHYAVDLSILNPDEPLRE